MTSLAGLMDRKRRILGEYLHASDGLLELLEGEAPDADALAPFMDRREAAVGRIRRLDKSVEATPSTDQAAEIVAAAALRRSLEEAASRDGALRDALADWRRKLAEGLGVLAKGRRSLRAYRGDTGTPAPTVFDSSG